MQIQLKISRIGSYYEHEISVLSKGFNYATDHSPRDVLLFIAEVEPVIEDLQGLSHQ